MKRTIRPNPTSWDLPLSGRSDLRTGSRGQRRRTPTRTAAGAQIRRPPFDGLPAPASPSRIAYRSRRASADDYGLVDQRLIAAPVVIQAEPEGRHGDQWSRIEWLIRTDHISGDVPIVFILEPLCPLLHRHGLALAVVVDGPPVPVSLPVHGRCVEAGMKYSTQAFLFRNKIPKRLTRSWSSPPRSSATW